MNLERKFKALKLVSGVLHVRKVQAVICSNVEMSEERRAFS